MTDDTKPKRTHSHAYIVGDTIILRKDDLEASFEFAPASPVVMKALAMEATCLLLMRGYSLDDLMAGKFSDRALPDEKTAKGKRLSPWRLAGAYAHAHEIAKSRGIRGKPGVKLFDHPEFLTILEESKTLTAAWDEKKLASAKMVPAIVEHYNRITGTQTALDDLFAVSDPVVAVSEAAE